MAAQLPDKIKRQTDAIAELELAINNTKQYIRDFNEPAGAMMLNEHDLETLKAQLTHLNLKLYSRAPEDLDAMFPANQAGTVDVDFDSYDMAMTFQLSDDVYQDMTKRHPVLADPSLLPWLVSVHDNLAVLGDTLLPDQLQAQQQAEAQSEAQPGRPGVPVKSAKEANRTQVNEFIASLEALNLDSVFMRQFYGYFVANKYDLSKLTAGAFSELVMSEFQAGSLLKHAAGEDIFLRQYLQSKPQAGAAQQRKPAGQDYSSLFQYSFLTDPKNYTFGALGMNWYAHSGTRPLVP